MKILVIDNHTIHLDQMLAALEGYEVEVQKYEPGIKFNEVGKDLVVLSGGGGEGRELVDRITPGKLWYQDELNFIRKTKLPIIGVCMGFELIAKAFGSNVNKLPRLDHGFRIVELAKDSAIRQFEAHRWAVQRVDQQEFEILARSPRGIEMIKHHKRPIVATQFHPEVPGGSLGVPDLLKLLPAS